MRTSTAAWAAALAVMSMRGPFTTAEAAPARLHPEAERPRHFVPKHLKERGYNHTASAVESSSDAAPESSSQAADSSSPPSTSDESSSSHSRRSRASTKTQNEANEHSILESLLAAGKLPETENTVVTTTMTEIGLQGIDTYTITYTETSSPAPSDKHSKPLLTSSLSVLPGTAPSSSSTSPTDTSSSSFGDSSRSPTSHTRSAKPKHSHLGNQPPKPVHGTGQSTPVSSSSSSPISSSSSSAAPVTPSSSSAPVSSAVPQYSVQPHHSGLLPHSSIPLPGNETIVPPLQPTGNSVTSSSSSAPVSSSSLPIFSSLSSLAPSPPKQPPGLSSFPSVGSLGSQYSNIIPTASGISHSSHAHGSLKHHHPSKPASSGLLPSSEVVPTLSSQGSSAHGTGHILPSILPSLGSQAPSIPGTGALPSSIVVPTPSSKVSSAHGTGQIIPSVVPSLGSPGPSASNGLLSSSEIIPTLSLPGSSAHGTGQVIPSVVPTLGSQGPQGTGGRNKPNIISSLIGSTGGAPLTEVSPTAKSHQSHHASQSETSSAPIIVGLSTVLHGTPTTNPLGATSGLPIGSSQLGGISGLPTGVTSATITNGVPNPFTQHSTGGEGQTTSTDGIFPLPGQSGAPSGLSSVGQITTNIATTTGTGLPAVPPSIASGLPSGNPTSVVPYGGPHTHPLSSLVSSLKSHASSIIASATGSGESQISSVVSSVASATTGVTGGVVPTGAPVPSSTIVDSTGGTHVIPVPTPTQPSITYTITGQSTSVIVSVPTSSPTPGTGSVATTVTGASPPTTTAATSTAPSSEGSVPAYGEGSTASATSTEGEGSTASATSTEASATTTESGVAGSTKSTNIPLTGGASGPIASSGIVPSSSVVQATPPPSSNSATPVKTGSTESTESTEHTTPSHAPQTIVPTGTNTQTKLTLPTVWTFAPTSSRGGDRTTINVATSTSDSASGALPTYMPRLIQPPRGMPGAPPNSTLVQFAFNFGLNFLFVVNEEDSAGQIFLYLPQGISYGLGISEDKVVMKALLPYDTSHQLNYITTLAQAYVPTEVVNQLQLDLHTASAAMYDNPDSPVRSLMNMINPTFPLIPGSSVDGIPSSSQWWNSQATSGPSIGDGAPIGGDSGSSNKVSGKTIGIGAGAACGAAVYAVAMIYVARRYRQKRHNHRRVSSVHNAPSMSQTAGVGAYFMSGANGRGSNRSSAARSGGRGSRNSAGSSNARSVREQGISAPIMSENSLGWT